MRIWAYSAACLLTLLLWQGCNKADVYNQKVKSLDSLSGAVNSMMAEMNRVDTAMLQRSVLRYAYYDQFIRHNLKDTLSKQEADQLQDFYSGGKNLQSFSVNRRTILARAALVNTQLQHLTEDVRKRSLNEAQVERFTAMEKAAAAKLIEAGYQQQRIFHAAMEEFKTSLPAVEQLIRSRNHGELPRIIKDTITL